MQTLKDLLEQAKRDREVRSGTALAALAEKHGHPVTRTTINHLLAGTYKSRPTKQLLEAIAWLARVDINTVYEAAQLPLPGPAFADDLPPDVDTLLPHQRRAVVEVVRGFLADNERMDVATLYERVGLMTPDEIEVFLAETHDTTADALHAVLEHREQARGKVSLPSMSEARDARRRRLQEQALPAGQAAYDEDDSEPDR